MIRLKICAVVLLLSCLTLQSSFGQSKWGWADPIPQGNSLAAICPVDPSAFFICGAVGCVIRGTTGHSSWDVMLNTSGLSANIVAISFYNRYRGIAACKTNILTTSDGGKSWIRQPNINGGAWTGVTFRHDAVPFCISATKQIIYTLDLGGHWNGAVVRGPQFWYTDIKFGSAKVGYVVGRSSTLLRTTDGGFHWDSVGSIPGAALNKTLTFLNARTGFCATGTLYRTDDSGSTWAQINASGIRKVSFLDSLHGVGITGNGTFFFTRDGGNTWLASASSFHSNILNDVAFNEDGTVTAIDALGIYSSSDTGRTWTSVSRRAAMFNESSSFNSVSFAHSGRGFAVGTLVAASEDRGRSWRVALPSDTDYLMSVDVSGDSNAIAVGERGRIVYTLDAGSTWGAARLADLTNLMSVSFLDRSSAVAVGDSGRSYRTTDSGKTWILVPTPASLRINAVDFADTKHGYAVATAHQLLNSTDGGLSWTLDSSSGFQVLWSVSCLDSKNAIAVGDAGAVVRTSDGGTTWKTSTAISNVFGQSVVYLDSSDIIITGYGGEYYGSTDGGKTWPKTYQQIADNDFFTSANYFSPDTAVMVGQNCILYMPATRDTSWFVGTDTTHYPPVDTLAIDTTLGVAQPRINPLRLIDITPNPSQDICSVRFTSIAQAPSYVQLIAVSGLVVRQTTLSPSLDGFNAFDLSVADLPSGMYLLRISQDQSVFSGKLLVAH